jgi:hypothetical protein
VVDSQRQQQSLADAVDDVALDHVKRFDHDRNAVRRGFLGCMRAKSRSCSNALLPGKPAGMLREPELPSTITLAPN